MNDTYSQIKEAKNRVGELKTQLNCKDGLASSEEIIKIQISIELEKVRSYLLIAEALDRVATNVRR